MAELFKCDLKLEGLEELRQTLSGDLIRKAMRSALDRTGTYGKKQLVDEVTSEYNVSTSDVRSKIEVIRTTQSAMEILLKTVSRKLSLTHFGARQAPKGVLVNIRRNQISFYEGAWVDRLRNRYVAIRKIRPWPPGVGRGHKGRGRGVDPRRAAKLRMKGLPGPSVTDMVRVNFDKVADSMVSFFKQEFWNQIFKRTSIGG
jgi:hypothetical protein